MPDLVKYSFSVHYNYYPNRRILEAGALKFLFCAYVRLLLSHNKESVLSVKFLSILIFIMSFLS